VRPGGVAYYPAKSRGSVVGLLNSWGAFLGSTLIVPASTAALSRRWPEGPEGGRLDDSLATADPPPRTWAASGSA